MVEVATVVVPIVRFDADVEASVDVPDTDKLLPICVPVVATVNKLVPEAFWICKRFASCPTAPRIRVAIVELEIASVNNVAFVVDVEVVPKMIPPLLIAVLVESEEVAPDNVKKFDPPPKPLPTACPLK